MKHIWIWMVILGVSHGLVHAQTCKLEDFEKTDVWPWPPWVMKNSPPGVVNSSSAHSGSFGISNPSWEYRTDINYGRPGEWVSAWFKFVGLGRAYFGVGASSSGCHSAVVGSNTNTVVIQRNNNFGYQDLASVPYIFDLNKWYKLVISWPKQGRMRAEVYDTNGTTSLVSLEADVPLFTAGGIAMRGFSNGVSTDLDDLEGSNSVGLITIPQKNVCVSDVPQNLMGSPTGGTFSGTGVSGTQFLPSMAGPGVHEITYTFTNKNGCGGTGTIVDTIIVHDTLSMNFGQRQEMDTLIFWDMSTPSSAIQDRTWIFDGTPFSSDSLAKLHYGKTGEYQVCLEDKTPWCGTSRICSLITVYHPDSIPDSTSSLDLGAHKRTEYWPNPVSSGAWLHVNCGELNLSSTTPIFEFQDYLGRSMQGQTVRGVGTQGTLIQSGSWMVRVPDLPAGSYHLLEYRSSHGNKRYLGTVRVLE